MQKRSFAKLLCKPNMFLFYFLLIARSLVNDFETNRGFLKINQFQASPMLELDFRSKMKENLPKKWSSILLCKCSLSFTFYFPFFNQTFGKFGYGFSPSFVLHLVAENGCSMWVNLQVNEIHFLASRRRTWIVFKNKLGGKLGLQW